MYDTTIVEVSKRGCVVSILKITEGSDRRTFGLHVGIAPTKNIDRFEWFLEKATEIGISEITPLICQRSERTVVKTERLRGVIIAAMKQSLKTELPQLNEVIDFQRFMQQTAFENQQKFIAHCYELAHWDFEKSAFLKTEPLPKIYEKASDAVILIGPEGDFTEAEVARAQGAGFVGISLGNSRLRTETAGVVAVHSIHFVNGL